MVCWFLVKFLTTFFTKKFPFVADACCQSPIGHDGEDAYVHVHGHDLLRLRGTAETLRLFGRWPDPDILGTMPGNLFDVFVVGSSDPSAAGETRLAAALSAKHGIPLATVVKAISAKNLRAGQSLEQAQAQALVRHLQSIGAVTVIRAAGARPQAHAPSPSQVARVPIAQPSPLPPSMASRAKMVTPAPGSGWPGASAALGSDPGTASPQFGQTGAGGFGMPSVGSMSSGDPFAPVTPGISPASAQPGAPDPFQPKRTTPPVLGTAARPRQSATPSPPGQRNPSTSGLALDVTPGPKLELARGDRGGGLEEDMPAAASRQASASAGSLRELGMGASSGVAMDEDPKNLNLVRCVQHGLYYDKSKASGCRKCLSSAREVVNKMEAQAASFHVGDFRRKPAKRAFVGLVFALVLGFLPAVYYCFGPGTTEVRKLRVEQELMSRQPGTEEIMRRFDELDVQVGEAHSQATRNTSIVWVAVASVAMLGWYKIT